MSTAMQEKQFRSSAYCMKLDIAEQWKLAESVICENSKLF